MALALAPLVLVALVLVALAPTVPAAPAGAAPRAGRALAGAGEPALRWRPCGGFQCATLPVPLDHADPSGPRIELSVIRAPAREPDRRIGALVVNPGGPGGSGVDYVRDAATSFPGELRDRFDIVGFDPRGVGGSGPVDCVKDMGPYYALDFSPDTPAERDALVAGVRAFVDGCVRNEGERLAHLSTDDTVRDLDRIRAALGDDRLTYLGFSYGTVLGARYAAAYPDRVRALVLDGALDPSLDATQLVVQQAAGFEHVLDSFLRWCARDTDCAFRRGGRTARAFDRLSARVDREGLAVPGTTPPRRLTATEFDLALAAALYEGRRGFSFLGEALDAADRGDGRGLAELSDAYTERHADGTYGGIEEAFLAISCSDGPPVGGLDGVRAAEEQVVGVAPRLGRAIVNNSLACAFWPVPAPQPAPIRAPGAPPILVIGTRHDPATPLAWARSLAEQLESGVLVTAPGDQHTAFGLGNACVDSTVVRYLVDLEVPSRTRRC